MVIAILCQEIHHLLSISSMTDVMINSLTINHTRNSFSTSGLQALALTSDALQPVNASAGKEARSFVLQLAQQQLGTLANKDSKALSDEDVDDAWFLSDLIAELSEDSAEEAAYESAVERTEDFNDYLRESASDRQIVQSVETEGGVILGDYEEFFVAEDFDGNRYTIEKDTSEEFLDEEPWEEV